MAFADRHNACERKCLRFLSANISDSVYPSATSADRTVNHWPRRDRLKRCRTFSSLFTFKRVQRQDAVMSALRGETEDDAVDDGVTPATPICCEIMRVAADSQC